MSHSRTAFGPWSSALQDEPGLRLSHFWQRRLSLLPTLSDGPNRISRWTVVSLLMIAVVAASVPTLRFAAAAEDRLQKETESETLTAGLLDDALQPPRPDPATLEKRSRELEQTNERLQKEHNRTLIAGEREKRRREAERLLKLLQTQHNYALAPDELARFMPAASAPAIHDDYVRVMTSSNRELTSLFQPRDGDLVGTTWLYDERTLASLLDSLLGLKLHRFEGDVELLDTPLHGDWILAWGALDLAPFDAAEFGGRVAAVETTLRERGDLPIRLKLATADRPVYVAQGDYRFKAIAGPDGRVAEVSGGVAERADGTFQIPARRTTTTGTVARGFDELLEHVGEVLMTPIVDEVATPPAKPDFFIRFDGKPPKDLREPLDEATYRRVLDAMSEQTGLTFTKAVRPVRILVVTRD